MRARGCIYTRVNLRPGMRMRYKPARPADCGGPCEHVHPRKPRAHAHAYIHTRTADLPRNHRGSCSWQCAGLGGPGDMAPPGPRRPPIAIGIAVGLCTAGAGTRAPPFHVQRPWLASGMERRGATAKCMAPPMHLTGFLKVMHVNFSSIQ